MSFLDILQSREYSRSSIMMSTLLSNITFTEDVDNQNFYIKENNAYTEDNVLVYNIFVYSIPKQLTEDDVRRYFSKFGNVLDVKLVADKRRSRRAAPKVGFVNFAASESACSALRKNNHRLQGVRIGVKPGDSWNQPNAEKACGSRENDNNVATTSKQTKKHVQQSTTKDAIATNSTHMLALNDDCLESIFGFLDLKAQVRFARVCQRFQDIFQIYCKREFKNFELHKMCNMTLWEMRDFLRFAGDNITSITGKVPYKNRERIMDFIRTFCVKLKCIKLDNSKTRNECLKKLLRGIPQLQELTLRDCALTDNSIQTMTHLKHLETLELAENYELTGKFISKLVQLKVLNFYGCSNIQTFHLVDICKTLPNLKSLDIRRCERIAPTLFDIMVKHCKELEILKMSCPEFPYERVAFLPSLKQLELLYYSWCSASQKRLLAELVTHKADQLEVLKIVAKNTLCTEHIELISQLRQLKVLFASNNPSVNDDSLVMLCKLQQLEELTIKGCSNITNQSVIKLVKSCQSLRHLNIQFCKKITIEFLLETIRFLKTTEKRKKPLVLVVYGTLIDHYGVSACDEYKEAEAQSLIKVIFHASNVDLGLDDGVDIYDIWDGEQWNDDDDGPTEDDDEDIYFPESDMDDDDIDFAYDIFGRIYPHGHDINDVIW
uniref:Putative RNA-binding protein EEED8.10 n=1 Tax=Zeugodacus cucurbitae TaxID=28588 RepID=A0A0A1XGF6_ZEUCU